MIYIDIALIMVIYLYTDTIPTRPSGLYALVNQPPPSTSDWHGRIINMALYKGKTPFIVKQNVGVGSIAEMTIDDQLYIGILVDDGSSNIADITPGTPIVSYVQGFDERITEADRTFFAANSDTLVNPIIENRPNIYDATTIPANIIVPAAWSVVVTQLTKVDLTQYPNGVLVTITRDVTTLQFKYDLKSVT